jgi:hypothetical protein
MGEVHDDSLRKRTRNQHEECQLMKTGDFTSMRRLFAFLLVNECFYGDISQLGSLGIFRACIFESLPVKELF